MFRSSGYASHFWSFNQLRQSHAGFGSVFPTSSLTFLEFPNLVILVGSCLKSEGKITSNFVNKLPECFYILFHNNPTVISARLSFNLIPEMPQNDTVLKHSLLVFNSSAGRLAPRRRLAITWRSDRLQPRLLHAWCWMPLFPPM